jgi:hypothetical protein
MMPYAKYLSSRPFGFLQEGILGFYYMYIVKINDPHINTSADVSKFKNVPVHVEFCFSRC